MQQKNLRLRLLGSSAAVLLLLSPMAVLAQSGSAIIQGKVLDAATKEPVKEFRIEAGLQYTKSREPNWTVKDTVKSEDGAFEVSETKAPPRGEILVRISAPGYQPSEGIGAVFGKTLEDQEVLLEPAAEIKGTVKDAEGQPVPDATVILYSPIPGPRGLTGLQPANSANILTRGTTKKDGTFSIDEAGPGIHGIYAFHDSKGATIIPKVEISEPSEPLEVTLEPYASVEGFVYDGDKPVANGNVQLVINSAARPDLPRMNGYSGIKTGNDGSFQIPHVLGGVAYSCMSATSSGQDSRNQPIEPSAGETTFVVLGGEPCATVKGTVSVPDNVALARVSLSLMPEGGNRSKAISSKPMDDGSFELHGVAPGTYTLSVGFMNSFSDRLSYSERVEISDTGTVEKNVELVRPTKVVPGTELIDFVAKSADGSELDLSKGKEDRFLVWMLIPGYPPSEGLKGMISSALPTLEENGIKPLVLVSTRDDPEQAMAVAKAAGVPDDVYFFRKPWAVDFSRRYTFDTRGLTPPLLIDRDGKVLAICPNLKSLEDAIKENSNE